MSAARKRRFVSSEPYVEFCPVPRERLKYRLIDAACGLVEVLCMVVIFPGLPFALLLAVMWWLA